MPDLALLSENCLSLGTPLVSSLPVLSLGGRQEKSVCRGQSPAAAEDDGWSFTLSDCPLPLIELWDGLMSCGLLWPGLRAPSSLVQPAPSDSWARHCLAQGSAWDKTSFCPSVGGRPQATGA